MSYDTENLITKKPFDQAARAGAAMGAFMREVTVPKHIDESRVTEYRVLVVTYTTHHTIRFPVRPGMGGVSDALAESNRYLGGGQPNIDASSIRYRVEAG